MTDRRDPCSSVAGNQSSSITRQGSVGDCDGSLTVVSPLRPSDLPLPDKIAPPSCQNSEWLTTLRLRSLVTGGTCCSIRVCRCSSAARERVNGHVVYVTPDAHPAGGSRRQHAPRNRHRAHPRQLDRPVHRKRATQSGVRQPRSRALSSAVRQHPDARSPSVIPIVTGRTAVLAPERRDVQTVSGAAHLLVAAVVLLTRDYACRSGPCRSCRIIQLMPNRSRSCPNRLAKNVSCIGMNTWPPSESTEKMRSASASLVTCSDK